VIYLGADHAGYALKEHLKKFLQRKGYAVKDLGTHKLVKTDDYPDYAAKVAKAVQKKGMGILVCGSAEGICIAANKFRGIRAVPVWTVQNARLSRAHNDANILCISGGKMKKRVQGVGLNNAQAEKITLAWLRTPFSREARHVRRIKKIARLER